MGNLKPKEQFLKGAKQQQLGFDKQGHSELQSSSFMFGLFVIFFLIMFGPQLNRNLGLIISKDTFLSSKSLLSFDSQRAFFAAFYPDTC